MTTGVRQRREGFILVSVLVVIAMLAGFVGAISLVARQAIETARVARDRLVDDALAQAAIEIAAYQLFALDRPVADVDGQEIRFDDGRVLLSVSSDAGLVDLNTASASSLAEAWAASKLGSMSPERFASRVLDWRDADDEALPDGAEADEYIARGLGHTPHNGPFRKLSELRFVLGIEQSDLDALARRFTVLNPGDGADGSERRGDDDGPGLDVPRRGSLPSRTTEAASVLPAPSSDEAADPLQPGSAGYAGQVLRIDIAVYRHGSETVTLLSRVGITPSVGGRSVYHIVSWL